MKKSNAMPQVYIDPVCLMKVDPFKRNIKFTHKMRTYYFCAEACRNAFEANPDEYLESKPGMLKSWWNRYLERLNKATGGRAPHCH